MRLLADRLPAHARVLVIGGEGLVTVVQEAGFEVVRSADDAPDAVVQGFAPELGWADLAEASFALADPDRLWVATNTDWTIPVERGIAPGNGTLVSAVHAAVGRLPLVAGKPETPLFETAVERFAAERPFFVGDRLDTDIAGANAAGMPSALVLTGIDGPREVLAAPREGPPAVPARRPHRAERALSRGAARIRRVPLRRRGRRIDGRRIEVVRGGAGIDVLRAAAAAVWGADASAYALDVPDAVLAAR